MIPFFSIVIPLYNKENEIVRTLTSVLEQTFQDFEVIIVNDGSNDNSLLKSKSIRDERITIYSIENKGVSYARNLGIEKAKADYIAFLDADDIWYDHHLEDLKKLIRDFPNCGMYCKAYEKDYFGKHTVKAKFNKLPENFRGIVPNYFENSLIDPIAWTSALAIPKTLLEQKGGFDQNIHSGQDTDLWISIALEEKIAFSSKISSTRIFGANYHLSKSKKLLDRQKIFEKFTVEETINESLKKYMDYNRFSFAIQQKAKGNYNTYIQIMDKVDKKNLNLKRRVLGYFPSTILRQTKIVQNYMVKKGYYLSAFR